MKKIIIAAAILSLAFSSNALAAVDDYSRSPSGTDLMPGNISLNYTVSSLPVGSLYYQTVIDGAGTFYGTCKAVSGDPMTDADDIEVDTLGDYNDVRIDYYSDADCTAFVGTESFEYDGGDTVFTVSDIPSESSSTLQMQTLAKKCETIYEYNGTSTKVLARSTEICADPIKAFAVDAGIITACLGIAWGFSKLFK